MHSSSILLQKIIHDVIMNVFDYISHDSIILQTELKSLY